MRTNLMKGDMYFIEVGKELREEQIVFDASDIARALTIELVEVDGLTTIFDRSTVLSFLVAVSLYELAESRDFACVSEILCRFKGIS